MTSARTFTSVIATGAAALLAAAVAVPAASASTRQPVTATIWQWPSESVLMNLKPGQVVPMTKAGTMTLTPADIAFLKTGEMINLDGNRSLMPQLRCAPTKYQNSLGKQWATVGATFSTIRRVTQRFTYEAGQSSTLGIGVSTTDKAGSFHADHTDTVTRHLGDPFPAERGVSGWHYRTEFIYHQFSQQCIVKKGTPNKVRTYHYVRAVKYAGGAKSVGKQRSFRPTVAHCVYYQAGNAPYQDTSAATTFSAGVSLPVIEFGASAQTGYDHDARVEFDFGRGGYLCGQKDVPGGSPGLLEASRTQ